MQPLCIGTRRSSWPLATRHPARVNQKPRSLWFSAPMSLPTPSSRLALRPQSLHHRATHQATTTDELGSVPVGHASAGQQVLWFSAPTSTAAFGGDEVKSHGSQKGSMQHHVHRPKARIPLQIVKSLSPRSQGSTNSQSQECNVHAKAIPDYRGDRPTPHHL